MFLNVKIMMFICICPKHFEWKSCQNMKKFIFTFGFLVQIVTNMYVKGRKKKL